MSQTSDVIIIGAGVIGCATAFHLAEHGMQVTVLEKGAVGSGATGRSSSIVRRHYSNQLTARMAIHSFRVFKDFDDFVGGDCDFRVTGWFALTSSEDLAGMKENIELLRGLGIETEMVPAAELGKLIPGLETGDFVSAAFEPEGGYADPHLTVTGYANAARRLRARIVQGCRVTGIRFVDGRVAGVDTTADSYAAPIVVNCAGPWGAQVAEMAGVTVPITSSRVQVSVFRTPAGYSGHPVVMDFINGIYLRPETGNITLVGSIDPAEADDEVDPDDYLEQATDGFVTEMGEQCIRRYPPMAESECLDGYASLYAITPDWHPIIDEIPSGSGCYICSGFSGHGFKLAPAVGLMTADLIAGTSDPEFSTELFRLGRFDEGDLVKGRYEYSIFG